MSAVNPCFNNFFTEFSNHLDTNYSRITDPENKEEVRNADKRIRRLDSLARLANGGDSYNCVAVAVHNNDWYFAANDYDKIADNVQEIFEGFKKIEKNPQGEVVSTSEARDYLIDEYLASCELGVTTKNRLIKDVKKFLSALKTDTIFTKIEVERLLNPHVDFIYYSNEEKLHAETVILCDLADKAETKPLQPIKATVGISKLCCKLCAASASAFHMGAPNLEVKLRGRHGNFYWAWTPPELLLHGVYFKRFVGPNAYQQYKNADPLTQVAIKHQLRNLNDGREILADFFTAGRGGVNLNSDSPAPPNTDEASDYESASEEASDSDSDIN